MSHLNNVKNARKFIEGKPRKDWWAILESNTPWSYYKIGAVLETITGDKFNDHHREGN